MKNEDLTPFYYLNNFNSYTEGLITMFNVAVVNDWHAIAEVFLYADRNSSDLLVYSFFVSAICCMVFIMINVITAFFVESKFWKSLSQEPQTEFSLFNELSLTISNPLHKNIQLSLRKQMTPRMNIIQLTRMRR